MTSFSFIKFYLVICLHWVLTAACGVFTAARAIFYGGAQASLDIACGCQSEEFQYLQPLGLLPPQYVGS